MDISEIERKLMKLDKDIHSILELIRAAKTPDEDVIESVSGAWGYDVDSVEFVRELRKTRRITQP